MKKRKIHIWVLIPLAYSILRLGLTFVFMDATLRKSDMAILDNFQIWSHRGSVLLLVGALVGIVVTYCFILRDTSSAGDNRVNYRFALLIPIIAVKGIVDIVTVLIWDLRTFGIMNRVLVANGMETEPGHPVGVGTVCTFVVVVLRIAVVTVAALIMQFKYREFCHRDINGQDIKE